LCRAQNQDNTMDVLLGVTKDSNSSWGHIYPWRREQFSVLCEYSFNFKISSWLNLKPVPSLSLFNKDDNFISIGLQCPISVWCWMTRNKVFARSLKLLFQHLYGETREKPKKSGTF
jgi:hypothetical protein